MDFIVLLVMFFVVRALFHVLNFYIRYLVSGKVPPGPFPFPIVGNILQFGMHPHRSLAKLSKKYGPLMSLQLGDVYTVVVSSPDIAKEILIKHDHVSCNRTITAVAEAHNHHKHSMVYLPTGNKWRKLRQICAEHVFASHRLEESEFLRQEKAKKLCEYLHECSSSGKVVNIGEAAFVTSLNLISGTLFSTDVAEFESDSKEGWKEAIEGVAWMVGAPTVVDFFQFLKAIDPQEIKSQSEIYFGKLLGILEGIINTRLQSRNTFVGALKKNDLLETLLDLIEGNEFDLSCEEIKHLLLDLFVVGTDTVASTVEWAMTYLLLNRQIMSKAKNELEALLGETKQVQESDISRLPYLQALIKETFRYHPPCLLLPRKSKYDLEINGYIIPRDTEILVNVWAMGRESNRWSNPDTFEPERFLDCKIDITGQDLELFPFGLGRRMCPGVSLAHRMIHLMVASIIRDFDWKMEPGFEIDTNEDFGLSLHKAVPLLAIPIKL